MGFKEIVAHTFPMGSMTGAPKIRCMELIDQYENFSRGWFSGAVGYISADGDFDFNVVIRSIIMDKSVGRLFFAVGSAITFDADPIQEYEECLLKAQPIFDVLAPHSRKTS
jgi:para-aminobenzoate synthetase component 1